MAEVLSVVASGAAFIQLAGQVAQSIVKLKRCWDQVKDAPEDIRVLVREIELLNLVLCQVQDDQTEDVTLLDSGIGTSAKICVTKSLESCQEGADKLSVLVDDLVEKVEGKTGWRKKVGSSKIVLKKPELKRLKREMKSAIRLLTLAHGCHTS